MKWIKTFMLVTAITVMTSCNGQKQTKKALTNEIDSVSYALGVDMAAKLQQNFSEVDRDLFVQGYTSGADSTDLLIDKTKVDEILGAFFQKKQAASREKQQAEALTQAEEKFGDNKAAGIKFLEDNKAKAGVKATASGLQYKVLKQGSGAKPTTASKVKVHYHGTLIDGSVFDSSVDRGEPAEFGVTQVIKGWTEGLQLMNVGSKYRFFIPQELAYGAFPRQGGPIKPFSTLVFDVELLEITK